jgi:hypothetical protein
VQTSADLHRYEHAVRSCSKPAECTTSMLLLLPPLLPLLLLL